MSSMLCSPLMPAAPAESSDLRQLLRCEISSFFFHIGKGRPQLNLMRPSVALLAAWAALASGFVQRNSPLKSVRLHESTNVSPSHVKFGVSDRSPRASSKLSMAFPLKKEGEETNMFDGPLALTRERDACGVGFIANTKSGGAYSNSSKTSPSD